jgi:hypothetical protein
LTVYVRFVIGAEAENAYWLTGVFAEARILRDNGELFAHEVRQLDEAYAWFNERIPCPPFTARRRDGVWSADAVSWFRDDAGEPLHRIWDIVAILHEHGTPVRLVKSAKPGRIVYQDRFQIVAETPRWA